jgi:two-component system response regulator DesR
MEAGASGFLVKDAPAEQLADAIRRVHTGLRVVDPALAAETLATGESPLTGRERDVLVAARDGGTVADIARLLVLSDGTVRNYLSSAMGKTGARTRAEAVLVASGVAGCSSARVGPVPRPLASRRKQRAHQTGW